MILTRNTAELRQVVEKHVAAYAVIQSDCFDVIFCLNDIDEPVSALMLCLNHSNDPVSAEKGYGLPIMVQRIADSIFDRLPAEDALKFLAALPDAIGCDGKDLSRVAWKFLAQTLRNMPPQPAEIQAVVDPVIAGLELLGAGKEWPAADVAAADDAARWAAVDSAARIAAAAAVDSAARWGARWGAAAAVDSAARWAAAAIVDDDARWGAVALQRDLLLQLLTNAPVLEGSA